MSWVCLGCSWPTLWKKPKLITSQNWRTDRSRNWPNSKMAESTLAEVESTPPLPSTAFLPVWPATRLLWPPPRSVFCGGGSGTSGFRSGKCGRTGQSVGERPRAGHGLGPSGRVGQPLSGDSGWWASAVSGSAAGCDHHTRVSPEA